MKKQKNIINKWDDFDQPVLSIFDSDDDQQADVRAYAPFIKNLTNKDLDTPQAFKTSGRPNKHYTLSQNSSNHSLDDKDQSEQQSVNSIQKLNRQNSIDDNEINFSQLHFSMNDLTEEQLMNSITKLPPLSQVQVISEMDSQQQIWQDQVKKEYQKCQEFIDRRRLKRGSKKIKPPKNVNDEQFCRYRRKRIIQRPKGLTKEQLERLKEDFEQLHNQQSQQQDQPSILRKKTYQNNKLSIRQLAKKYCTTKPTIHSLYRQWRFDPTLSRALSKFQRQFILTHGGAHTIIARTKTQMRIMMLQQIIEQNPFLTQLELAVALRNKDPDMNRNVERSVILRLLRLGNFKKKKIRILSKERNDQIHIQLRRKYAQRYRQCIVKEFNVYFYDQMLINECYDKDTGWCKSEEQVKFRPEKLINTSIVVIGILSSGGRLTWNAKFGNYTPEAIQTVLDKMLQSNENKSTRNVLVLNPLPYRDMTRLIRIARDRDWLTLQLPIHGLQLNPLYPYFLQLKDVLRKIRFTTVEKLFEDVEIVLREREDSYYGKKYIQCLNMYIIRALAKQKF